MKLYLIRHGQTDWNTAGKIQGSTDIPLNEKGLAQAACLAKGMEGRPVARVYTSPLQRAAKTGEALAHAQHVKIEPVEGLREVGFGAWEGKNWDTVSREYPDDFRRWVDDPFAVAPSGGEPQMQIRKRCGMAMDYIVGQAERLKGDVAVVSHGAALAYILEWLMKDVPLDQEIIVGNASITTVDYDNTAKLCMLLEKNDTRHL